MRTTPPPGTQLPPLANSTNHSAAVTATPENITSGANGTLTFTLARADSGQRTADSGQRTADSGHTL